MLLWWDKLWLCLHLFSWISNHIHYFEWDEITYSFPNFNCAPVEVWEWKSNFIPHFTGQVITCGELFTVEMGAVARARLSFRVLAFTNKNIYIARDSIPNLWIGKCHIPVAQRLQSTQHRLYNQGVFGSSPIMCVLFSTFKNNCSQSKWVLVPVHGWHFVC